MKPSPNCLFKPWCRILLIIEAFLLRIATSRFSPFHRLCPPCLSLDSSRTSKSGYFCKKLTPFQTWRQKTTRKLNSKTHPSQAFNCHPLTPSQPLQGERTKQQNKNQLTQDLVGHAGTLPDWLAVLRLNSPRVGRQPHSKFEELYSSVWIAKTNTSFPFEVIKTIIPGKVWLKKMILFNSSNFEWGWRPTLGLVNPSTASQSGPVPARPHKVLCKLIFVFCFLSLERLRGEWGGLS